jgi:hypothetical protein
VVLLSAFSDAQVAADTKATLEQDPSEMLDGIQSDWQERRLTDSNLPGLPAVDVYLTDAIVLTDAPRGPPSGGARDDNQEADFGVVGWIGVAMGCTIALALVVVGTGAATRARRQRREDREAAARASSTLPEAIRRTLAGDVVEAIARAQTEEQLSRDTSGSRFRPGRPEEDPEMVLKRQQQKEQYEFEHEDEQARASPVSDSGVRSVGSSKGSEWGSGTVGSDDVALDLAATGSETERLRKITLAMLDHTSTRHLGKSSPLPTGRVVRQGRSDVRQRRGGGGYVDDKADEFTHESRPEDSDGRGVV